MRRRTLWSFLETQESITSLHDVTFGQACPLGPGHDQVFTTRQWRQCSAACCNALLSLAAKEDNQFFAHQVLFGHSALNINEHGCCAAAAPTQAAGAAGIYRPLDPR
jgi:hypothetical protein